MNSVAVIKSLRYYLANDATMRSYLSAADYTVALRQIVYQDSEYINKSGGYLYPAITFRLNEQGIDVTIPTNNAIVNMMLINKIVNPDPMLTLVRMKDRIKYLLIDKTNTDRKYELINSQGQALDCGDPKIRLVSWVGAATYDDVEQGSERLHKINCLLQLVVGD
jgi:hypothetical protein